MNLFFEQYTVSKHYDDRADAVLLEGDTLDILKQLPDNRFKLIVSSPPYNIGKIYEEEVSLEDYLAWQEKIIIELYRTCHINGSIVWQVGNYVDEGEIFPLDIYFYPIFKKMGLKL
ncbi:MAG: hypothetical protein LBQ82_08215, partial [Treponema sp.]|nr:hypothetical protein [Treponema sp.]